MLRGVTIAVASLALVTLLSVSTSSAQKRVEQPYRFVEIAEFVVADEVDDPEYSANQSLAAMRNAFDYSRRFEGVYTTTSIEDAPARRVRVEGVVTRVKRRNKAGGIFRTVLGSVARAYSTGGGCSRGLKGITILAQVRVIDNESDEVLLKEEIRNTYSGCDSQKYAYMYRSAAGALALKIIKVMRKKGIAGKRIKKKS